MKRFIPLALLFAFIGATAQAQDVPADYQQVLTTLGKTGRLQGQRAQGQHPAERSERHRRERQDADAVRLRRLGRDDQGHGRHGRDDGRSRADAGRSQSSDVGAARQRARGHRAPQSLLLGRAAHVLHARARARHAGRPGAQGEAGARPDWQRIEPAQPTPPPRQRQRQPPKMDTAKLAQIVGTAGEQNGDVYKITIGRDDLKLTEMGAPINARMGLNTWAAFVGTNDNAAIAGDVAMLASEVTPVLKALRKNGLDVVAIHHHMTGRSRRSSSCITGELAPPRSSRPASRPRSPSSESHRPRRPHITEVHSMKTILSGSLSRRRGRRDRQLRQSGHRETAGRVDGTQTGTGQAKWAVVPDDTAPSKPNVLKQSGQATYPVCLKDDTSLKDGFVEVKFKALSGREDQAGGARLAGARTRTTTTSPARTRSRTT